MNNHRIQVLTPGGKHIRYIIGELCLIPRERVIRPCSPANHRGTDVANQCISVFKTTGEFVTTFGEGKCVEYLESIAIDDDGFVYVTDSRAHIKKFYMPI